MKDIEVHGELSKHYWWPCTCKCCDVFKLFNGLKFDSLAGKCQKHQTFPLSNFYAIRLMLFLNNSYAYHDHYCCDTAKPSLMNLYTNGKKYYGAE